MGFRRIGSIAAEVIQRAETLRAAAEHGARPGDESPAEPMTNTDSAGVTGSAGGDTLDTDDRGENGRRGTLPGMQRGKPRSRSADGWTLPKPRKAAGTNAVPAAANQGTSVNEPTRPEARILRIVSRCEPRHDPSRLPRRGLGSHLMIVGGLDHGSPSPS
jgi:hypothetical protein